jgi:uncharacterized coiled-coil DUF342 family protein
VSKQSKQEKLDRLVEKRESLYQKIRDIKKTRKSHIKSYDYQISSLHTEINKVKDEIKGTHTSPDTLIKDHAIVRYMERFLGADTNTIRQEILAHGNAERLQSIKDGKLPIKGGHAVVKNGCVVTVIPHSDLSESD